MIGHLLGAAGAVEAVAAVQVTYVMFFYLEELFVFCVLCAMQG